MSKPRTEAAAVKKSLVSAAAPHVILFGELLADVFPDRQVAGGAPFNVACHLRGLGVQPLLATRLGEDALGDFLRAALTRFSLDTRLLQSDPRHASGRVVVTAVAGGHQFDIPPGQAFDHIDADALSSALAGVGPPPPRLIYFGTLAQRHPVSRAALARLLAHCPAPRFVDLNLRPPWDDPAIGAAALREANLVKLSEDELHVVGTWLGIDALPDVALARRVATHYGIAQLVVTCGARGAGCLCNDEWVVAEPPPVRPIGGDSVGAGDAFAAVLILGHLAGWPIAQTLARAGRFAAAVCALTGAVPEHPDFYLPFRQDWTA